ncbi:MAG: DUF4129 domain-containing protein [Chloroflexota bacterium]
MRRGATVAITAIACLTIFATPAFAETPIGYQRDLTSALGELGSGDPDGARRAAARLAGVGAVVMPDGSTIRPDNAAIIAALDATPPDVETARAELTSRLSAMSDASASGPGADARPALRGVLSRPEFQPAPPPDPFTGFLRNDEGVIGHLVGRILDRLFGSGEPGDPRTLFWAAVGLIAIAVAVFLMLRGVRRSIGPPVTRPDEEEPPMATTSEAARSEAERLAQAGAFRAAIRALYLAVLLDWDEHGELRFDRALTNREVVAKARSLGSARLVETLAPLVDRFDRVWYGSSSCTSEEYRAFRGLAERAWEAR